MVKWNRSNIPCEYELYVIPWIKIIPSLWHISSNLEFLNSEPLSEQNSFGNELLTKNSNIWVIKL